MQNPFYSSKDCAEHRGVKRGTGDPPQGLRKDVKGEVMWSDTLLNGGCCWPWFGELTRSQTGLEK